MREGDPQPDAVDYYSRIGVSPDADAETIEHRRKQADRRFSPMSSSPEGDEKRHMRINAASSVLEDPDERARYDHCYEAFGPNRGTAVYETLSTDVLDAVLEESMLADHLRGFVEIVGPVAGSRAFEAYYHEMNPTEPDAERAADLPDGYAVEDAGFGVAAWSFREAGQPCDRDRWLRGGRDLWRTALADEDSVDALVDDLETQAEQRPETVTTALETATDDATPTTRVHGHPSSGTSTGDLPSEYASSDEREASGPGVTVHFRSPIERVRRSLSYVLRTGVWGIGSVGATVLSGAGGLLAVATAFVPLLAIALLVQSALPGVAAAVESALGVPLASSDAPLTTVTAVHGVALVLLVIVPPALTARFVVPRIGERKTRGLPHDAWLVFVGALVALVAALVVGIGDRALPRPVALGAVGLLTAFTYQASLDVGGLRWLARLCTAVATLGFSATSSVAAVAVADTLLRSVDPALAAASTGLLTGHGPVSTPLVGPANAESVAVALGTLAAIPLALTTLYSIAYKVESLTFRLRSWARGEP